MKTIFLLFGIGILFNFSITAQSLGVNNTITFPRGNPEEVGVSPERLEKIDKMLLQAIEAK